MSAELPYARPEPSPTEITVGAPVRGRLAREAAHLVHYARAHGMQVIPAHAPMLRIDDGSPYPLYWTTEPSGYAIARVWVLSISQEEAQGDVYARMAVALPDTLTRTVHPTLVTGTDPTSWVFVEDLGAKTSAPTQLFAGFQRTAGGAAVTVEGIACWELPRAILALDSTDDGIDVETCQAGQPIYDAANRSLGEVARGVASTWPRRSLVQWSGAPLEVDSGDWVDLFALPIPCIPHKTLRADSHLECVWRVLFSTDTGTSGEVRVTTGIDATTDTLALGDGSLGWTESGAIEIRCEDLSDAAGKPGGAWETVQFAVRRTGGSGSIYVVAVSLWEPDLEARYLLLEDGGYVLLEDDGRIELE